MASAILRLICGADQSPIISFPLQILIEDYPRQLSLTLGYVPRIRGEVHEWLVLLRGFRSIQCLPYFVGERGGCEGLLQKRHAFFQGTWVADGVLGKGGGVENPNAGME